MTVSGRVVPALLAVVAVCGAAVPLTLSSARGDGLPQGEAAVALAITASAGVGLVIALARPGHPVGRLMLGGASAWGLGEAGLAFAVLGLVTEPGSVPGAAWLAILGTFIRGIGWLVLVLVVPLVFPDGHLPARPWRWSAPVAAAAVGGFAAATLLAEAPLENRLAGVPNPIGPPAWADLLVDGLALLSLGLAALALVGIVGGLVARWRRGDRLVRQQLLWFTLAAAAPVLLLPIVPTGLAEPVLFGVAALPLPLAIAVAVLQHRLYDVQFAVNRTVAWTALSVALALVYVLVVAGVGALLDARGASWLPWLATGLVALSVAPLRDALQQAANRLTYGLWAQPEAVLAGVRRRVADAGDAAGLLRELVAELGDGLRLARIAVLDTEGRLLAGHGSGQADEETPLTAYGRRVGTLVWSRPHRALRAGDRQLLDDLAGHLGALVHAATLVAGLRAARERLVLAREDERRRLRRDLHDGLGSTLAGLTFITEAAGNLLRSDVDAAGSALQQVRAGIQTAVLDVRRIVEGLTPPSLARLGLVGALAELADRLGGDLPGGMTVDAPPDLPVLNAAVEVAAYRVTQEALTNVVRHARASTCRMSLRHDGSTLLLEVADDGCGGAGPRPGGAGLPGMRERAEELGGELAVAARSGGGTTVRLRLPTASAASPRAAPRPAEEPAEEPAAVVAR
jgi:signal transduction histidine kinase